ncbi:MAG: TetR/AcrR family transcriptional regulator [Acetobacterium sp.]|nr:TetR/AcrR family transcriptional regulator [Acetobacterium sp.]
METIEAGISFSKINTLSSRHQHKNMIYSKEDFSLTSRFVRLKEFFDTVQTGSTVIESELIKLEKNDFRVVKSKEMIRSAFLDLVQEKGSAAVTVKSICDNAKLSRKTFYTYYETKEALCNDLLAELFSHLQMTRLFELCTSSLKEVTDSQLILFIDFCFTDLKKNAITFNILFSDSSNHEFQYQLEDYLRAQCTSALESNGQPKLKNIPFSLQVDTFVSVIVVIIKWWASNSYLSSREATKCMYMLLSKEFLRSFGLIRQK